MILIMKITEYIDVLRENVANAHHLGKKIVFVPTMGYLHRGHLSMAEAIRNRDENCEQYYVVMSIFVNPLQFGPGEDYEKYPRDLVRDTSLAKKAGVDLLFVPAVEEIYPTGATLTSVQVRGMSEGLCGAGRPGHFQGVATVVTKLFNIVRPDIAIFGQKDYQQFMVIRQLIHDLCFPIRLIMAPTVREGDGLAMSSRNAYLNEEERRQAPILYAALREGAALIQAGERNADAICTRVREAILRGSQARIEYVELRQAEDFSSSSGITDDSVILVAAKLGRTRLIDNLIVSLSHKEDKS